MATYTVKWSTSDLPGGKPAIVVPEKTFNNTSTSLVLTGKGLQNYGLFQQENFLRLLENFAGPTPPPNPTVGQLWYDTTVCALKVYGCSLEWTPVGGGGNSGLVVGDLAEYTTFAERINAIIGSPFNESAGPDFQYGWGQTDYVPTYTTGGALDSLSISRQAGLPSSQTFPVTFNNSAWAIYISRLRKALRQIGLAESQTSPIGFIDDGQPGAGNTLANIYNNLNIGPTPYQGTLGNIVGGFGGLTAPQVEAQFTATQTALDLLEQYRFSLGPTQTQIQSLATRARTAPTVSLGIPSAVNNYVHTVELTFDDYDDARAFFNSGGQIQFNMSFEPSSPSPSNVEQDWATFLSYFSGMAFDYTGVKSSATYASPSFTPTYYVNYQSSAESVGFYDLTSTNQIVFKRDVLDTPGIFNAYGPAVPPPNGGVVISARTTTGTNFVVTFDIQFVLDNVTTGSIYQNDTTDTSLTGTLTSNVTAFRANNLNRNSPVQTALVASDSGTFITAP